MVVFGLSTHFVLSLLVLAVSGGVDMASVVVRQTLVQLETPNDMRGRVSAVNSVFIGASSQLGEFESGATAALMGPVGSVVASRVGTLLGGGAVVQVVSGAGASGPDGGVGGRPWLARGGIAVVWASDCKAH